MKTTGLVLSGGAVRGIAHLGVLKALEENNITINAISGTSAGAIVGAFYADGYAPERILEIIKETKVFRLLRPAMSWKGILKMDEIQLLLSTYLSTKEIESLKIPLTISATNVKKGITEYFSEGNLITATCASSCIPVIFNPIQHNDSFYIDGGILNNLPTEPLIGKYDILIGVHCNPIDTEFDGRNAKLMMERALLLAITCNVYNRKNQCDYFIEPLGLEKFKAMDLSNIDAIYEVGYTQALQQIESFKIIENSYS